jgi:dienelactone hydrolase
VPRHPGLFGVGIGTITVYDRSAPTLDYDDDPPRVLSDERVISTQIWYPTSGKPAKAPIQKAAPDRSSGPFPVILFAHGYAVTPHTYMPLLSAWVEAGFVVVAPVFPVDNFYEWRAEGGGSAPEADISNEPVDVVDVLDSVARRAKRPVGLLSHLVDLSKLALAGQSDGASVVAALEYSSSYRADLALLPHRPLAVGIFSGQKLGDDAIYGAPSPAPALLDVQSDADNCNSTQVATQLYDAIAPSSSPRYFLELLGADHLGPYEGQQPWFTSVRTTSTVFFENALDTSRSAGAAALESAGRRAGVSNLLSSMALSLPATAEDSVCGVPSPNP